MLDLLKKLFTPVTKKNLGTVSIYWINEKKEKIDRASITFVLYSNGERDIIVDEPAYSYHKVKEHGYYHSVIIPWLRKICWASTDDESVLQQCIDYICEKNNSTRLVTPPTPAPEPQPKQDEEPPEVLTFSKKFPFKNETEAN